ncbi:hypothetical protein ARMGADRAFT_186348 [Armillaria gallica]|uniref:Uncharacterized protein n=1 Tax=Armillaria gallica TaxID=47427 RepID=A0A2H3DD88_ARMGA|nr:hypothetical protein ARMGADRAFT_186348 [Armillaria gallica]
MQDTMPSLNNPLSLFNWAKKVNFMARMRLEDVELCSTLILKVISTKIKSIMVTYPVATNTAVTIRFEAVSILDYTVYGRCAALIVNTGANYGHEVSQGTRGSFGISRGRRRFSGKHSWGATICGWSKSNQNPRYRFWARQNPTFRTLILF